MGTVFSTIYILHWHTITRERCACEIKSIDGDKTVIVSNLLCTTFRCTWFSLVNNSDD